MESNTWIELPGECGVFLVGGDQWADRLTTTLGADVTVLAPGSDSSAVAAINEASDETIGCVIVEGRTDVDWGAVIATNRDDGNDFPVFVTIESGQEDVIEHALRAGVTDVIRIGLEGWESILLHRIGECLTGSRRKSEETRPREMIESDEPVTDEKLCLDHELRDMTRNESARREPVDRSGLNSADLLGRTVDGRSPAFVETVADGIYTIDDDGHITSVNEAFVSLMGYDEDELLGMNISGCIKPAPSADGLAAVQTVGTTSITFQPVDGQPISAELRVERLPDNGSGDAGYVGVVRDVSERTTYEKQLKTGNERPRSVVENALIVLYALDTDGNYTLSVGKGLEALGHDPGELVGKSVFEYYAEHDQIVEDCRRVLDGEEVHSVVEIDDLVFANHYLPVKNDGGIDGMIGISIDITDQVRYERTLRLLHRTARELVDVQTPQDASQLVVEAAREVLDLSGAIVFRFEEAVGVLRLAASSIEPALQAGEDVPRTIEPGSGITWETFVRGESAIYDGDSEMTDLFAPLTAMRSGLFVPLGEYGVLVAASTDRSKFDQETVELAELLAASAEVTFDRVARESALRDRDRQLEAQNESLAQLDRVNEILRDVHASIVRANTRESIERAVCDRLTTTDRFGFAWIGSAGTVTNDLVSEAEAGDGEGYLDELSIQMTEGEREPAGIAARTGAITVVENVADDIGSEPWRRAALARGFQSVVSVPLAYGEHQYGVLTVYATEPDAFGKEIPAVLGELGETIGYAINAVERTHAIATDAVVALEYSLGERNCAGCRLAREANCTLDLVGLLPGENGKPSALYAVTGARLDRVMSIANSLVAFESVTALAEYDDGGLIRISFSMQSLPSLVAEYSGEVVKFHADSDGSRVGIEVPQSRDTRPIIDLVEEAFPDSQLISKHARMRSGLVGFEQVSNLLGSLTERQTEVLEVAYHGGYFETPRAATGEELAESLDISPAMFHRHLRAVEQRVFESILDRQHLVGAGG